jgi:5-methylcytosine-specific restriction endonuclease McrA
MPKQTSPGQSQGQKTIDTNRLDQVVADARRNRDDRDKGYREQALKLYPWVCGRCGRTFTHTNLRELTVHHRNHNHDDNPTDGSNWELLCLYCHDNEHQRYEEHIAAGGKGGGKEDAKQTTHKPFEGLEALLKGKK